MRKHWNYWDAPLNFWTGCHKVSPGCDNCWARAAHNKRHEAVMAGKTGLPDMYDQPFEIVQVFTDKLRLPITGGKPKTYFVNNTSDTFHHAVPDNLRNTMFQLLWSIPLHRYLLLTKRPDAMRSPIDHICKFYGEPFLPAHLWLGVTVEDQKRANKRIPLLIHTPAVHRWLSVEPMLEQVDLLLDIHAKYGPIGTPHPMIDWVVVGSESGANRRPCDLDWIYSIVDQCQNAQIPVFVKQLDLDGKCVHKWSDPKFPNDLKIRELPWEDAA